MMQQMHHVAEQVTVLRSYTTLCNLLTTTAATLLYVTNTAATKLITNSIHVQHGQQ